MKLNGDGKARLIRRRGWFSVQKVDLALLREQCGEASPSTCMVWLALLTIENDRRTSSFQIGSNVIRSLSGVSLRTTKTALYRLEELEFIKIVPNKVPGSKQCDANTYVLLRGWKASSERSGNGCTTGRAKDGADSLHRSFKESASALEESASAPETALRATAAGAACPPGDSTSNAREPRRW
jgi:hypothetical protein